MGRDLRIKVRLEADVKDAERGLRRAKKAADNAGKGLDNLGDAAKRSESKLNRFVSFMSKRFVVTLGDVTRVVSSAFRAMQSVITLEGQETALRGQLQRMGKDFDTFVADLDRAAAGTISTASIIENSSRALLLGIPVDEIAKLLEIAGSRALATGVTVSQAFNDISIGIGRGSPLILDNLGFVIKLGKVYEEFAITLGKTAGELTQVEQKQAILNTVLRQGEEDMKTLGTAADDTFASVRRGQADVQNLIEGFKRLSGAALPAVFSGLLKLKLSFQEFGTELAVQNSRIFASLEKIPLIGNAFKGLADEFLNLAVERSKAASSTRDQIKDLQSLINVTLGLTDATVGVVKNTRQAAEASQAYIDSMRTQVAVSGDTKSATEDLTVSYDGQAIAADNLVGANQQLAGSFDVVTTSADKSRQAVVRAGAATGGESSFGGGRVTARTSSSQSLVDAALADGARPTLGGTRIRVRGGSRLIA